MITVQDRREKTCGPCGNGMEELELVSDSYLVPPGWAHILYI